jgi:hypothetical protein
LGERALAGEFQQSKDRNKFISTTTCSEEMYRNFTALNKYRHKTATKGNTHYNLTNP